MIDDRPYCVRCGSPEVATVIRERQVCVSCYRQREGSYLLAVVRAGLDEHGRQVAPPIPNDVPIGWLVFVAPAASWPPGFGLLACDLRRCRHEQVGRLVGGPCPLCIQRGRNQIEQQEPTR